MDHLPEPSSPVLPQISVPFVCRHADMFDGLEFSRFPERLGWDKEELRDLRLDDRSREDVMSIVQGWLFFGTLENVLRFPLDFSNLINSEVTPTITTKCLPDLLRRWMATWIPDERAMDSWTPQQREHILASGLREAHRLRLIFVEANSALVSMSLPRRNKSIIPQEILLSIEVLLSGLSNAAIFIFGMDVVPGVGSSTHIDLHQFGMFKDWCPRVLERTAVNINNSALYFAGRSQHYSASQDHRTCTETDCTAEHVNDDDYTPSHACDTKACAFIGPDMTEIEDFLNHNQVPIVVLESDGNGRIGLRTVSSETTLYVAISHVWSHGLGNPRANKMPSCQLERLHSLVHDAHPTSSVAMWIDTLCVPVEEDRPQELAIALMRSTYRDAAKVLVLDQGLEQISHTLPAVDLLLHLTCSTWLGRVWTFQEAALARKLLVQFSDGPADYDELLRRVGDTLVFCAYETVSRELLNVCQTMRLVGVPESAGQNMDFAMWINALQKRRTTRWEDESICLATLLGFNLTAMDRSFAEQRMMEIYSIQKRFPSNIMFLGHPKLTQEGFKWAPRTWLQNDGGDEGSGGVLLSHPASYLSQFVPDFGLVMDLLSYDFESQTKVTIPMMFGDPVSHFVYIVASAAGTSYTEWTPETLPYWTGKFSLLFETTRENDDGRIVVGVLAAYAKDVVPTEDMRSSLTGFDDSHREIRCVHYIGRVIVALEPRFGRNAQTSDTRRTLQENRPVSRFCVM